MPEPMVLRARGLYLDENQLSEVPEGAFTQADNVVIRNDGVIRPRVGLRNYLNVPGSVANPVVGLFDHLSTFVGFEQGGTIFRGSSSIGSFPNDMLSCSLIAGTASGFSRYRAEQAAKSLFFTNNDGIRWIETISSNVSSIPGVPRCGDVTNIAANTTTGTWLKTATNTNDTTSYRACLIKRNANGVLMYGSPGGQLSVTVSSASWLSVTVSLPKALALDNTYYVQLYRSRSVTSPVVPLEEMCLCAEVQLDSTSITNGSIVISDLTPDDARGATAYWAPSQGGINNAREQPPRASDIASFRQYLFASNTIQKQRLIMRLLAVGGTTGGMVVGDTITISGPSSITIAGAASQSGTNFLVQTSLASPAQNIAATARSIVQVINLNSTYWCAYYLESTDDPTTVGQILIESKDKGSPPWAISSSRATCWSPSLASGSVQFDSQSKQNRLQYSVAGIHSAWPLTSYFDVGGEEYPIYRIKALGDSLFIFKQKGLYRLSGTDPSNFRVDLFDLSVELLAPDSVAVVDGAIYCWTSLGVMRITESGKSIVSMPISNALTAAMNACSGWGNTASAWGLGRQISHQYLLWLPVSTGSNPTYECYTYSTIEGAWTHRTDSAACGYELGDGRIILGSHFSRGWSGNYRSTSNVAVENRSGTGSDYCDSTFTVNVTAQANVGDDYINIDDETNCEAADAIVVNGKQYRVWDKDLGLIYLDRPLESTIAISTTLTVIKHIPVSLQYATATAGQPAMLKHFHSCTVMLREPWFWQLYVNFISDLNGIGAGLSYTRAIAFDGSIPGIAISGAWGQFTPGGSAPMIPGDVNNTPNNNQRTPRSVRTLVTRGHRRCSRLYVNLFIPVAQELFAIEGIALKLAEDMTERLVK